MGLFIANGIAKQRNYKMTCDISIEFYELIMVEEKDAAASFMLYLLSIEE